MIGMLSNAELAALPERARATVLALVEENKLLKAEATERGDMQSRIETLETVNAKGGSVCLNRYRSLDK